MSGPLERVTDTLRLILTTLTSGDCCLDLKPCRTALYLGGEVPWDNCEACKSKGTNGQLWANLINITPAAGGSDAGACPEYNWSAEIGIVRCIASLSNGGSVPTPAAIATDALQQAKDADQIYRALRCCPTRPEALHDVVLSSWVPLGPNGKCAGGAWTARGRLDVCCG